MTILIKNSMIVDGTGAKAYKGDVLIENGLISRIGENIPSPEGGKTIDAKGAYVTPGFINMHSHADCSAAMYPNMESTLGQGITTDFAGHCGLGVAPVEKYWLYMFPEKRAFTKVIPDPIGGINPYGAYIAETDKLREPFFEAYGQRLDWSSYGEFIKHLRTAGIGANFALVAGQAQIRLQAMGKDFRRGATDEEIAAMERALNEAMDAGALGLSLGLDYQPGRFADKRELSRLMSLVGQRGGIVTAHIRMQSYPEYGRPQTVLDGLNEFLALGKECGVKIHVSHISNAFVTRPENDDMTRRGVDETLKILDKARDEGVDVTWDVIPKYAFGPFHYPMAASMFQPYAEACGGCKGFSRALNTGNYRELIADEIRQGNHASRGIFTRFNPKDNPAWDTEKIITRSIHKNLEGKTLRQAAYGKDSLDFLLDLLSDDPYLSLIPTGRYPLHTPDRDAFVARDEATIALDTWTFDYSAALSEGDMPLECGSPATYEGMTVFLDTELKKGVPFETTIKKLTGNAAKDIGLKDRGFIKEGLAADVLVIDPDRFDPKSDLADPRHAPEGLDYVIVNGEIAVDHKVHTHIRSGEILIR